MLGDVIRGAIRGWFKQKWRGVWFEKTLWEPEVLKVHEFFTELVSMEGKYAVKLSITELPKISRKGRKRYNGRLWKMQMWSRSMSLYSNILAYLLTCLYLGSHGITSFYCDATARCLSVKTTSYVRVVTHRPQ